MTAINAMQNSRLGGSTKKIPSNVKPEQKTEEMSASENSLDLGVRLEGVKVRNWSPPMAKSALQKMAPNEGLLG